jgi:hypothetical protein
MAPWLNIALHLARLRAVFASRPDPPRLPGVALAP